jgi:hypothetical protein
MKTRSADNSQGMTLVTVHNYEFIDNILAFYKYMDGRGRGDRRGDMEMGKRDGRGERERW